MKLLHVCPTLNPQAGGTVTALQQLLSVAPQTQEVACLDSPDSSWLTGQPVPVHALAHRGGLYSYSPALVPWLRREAARFDCVIVHGVWQYASFGTWRALRGGRTPYVIFPHGMLDPWFQRTYPRKHLKKLPYWWLAERQVLRDARLVLYTAEDEKIGARSSFPFPPCREAIVPLGLAEPPTAELPSESEPYLLFIGRLDPKKGCDLLLQAFAQTWRGTAWRLKMAGPDSIGWQSALQAMAQELGIAAQVDWLGMIAGERKWQTLRGASALVLPSHQENFGLVLVESLACGVPVLTTRCVNIWREIVEAGAGLAETDDLEGIARLLDTWRGCDADKIKTMRTAAYQCFIERFEIKRAQQHFLATIQAAV